MNGAGTCKTLEDAETLSRSGTAALMVGTYTFQGRSGNPEPTYLDFEHYTINSRGLPNPGYPWCEEYLPQIAKIAQSTGLPLVVSVAGENPQEFQKMVELSARSGASAVELNLSCSNLQEVGRRPDRLLTNCPGSLDDLLAVLRRGSWGRLAIGVKLGVFLDDALRHEMAQVINHSLDLVAFVTCCNSLGGAFPSDDQGGSILGGNGFGSFAGPSFKPIALAQFIQMRKLLDTEIACLGVGGVVRGVDALHYVNQGAAAVQVVSTLLQARARVPNRGHRVLDDIHKELEASL